MKQLGRNVFLTLVSCGFLVGCMQDSSSKLLKPQNTQNFTYKRVIQFTSNDSQLQSAFEEIAERSPHLLITSADDFSEFRISLTSETLWSTSEKKDRAAPRLFGVLSTEMMPMTYRTHFKMTAGKLHTLDSGFMEKAGLSKKRVYPRMESAPPQPNIETKKALAGEIFSRLFNIIATTPWNTTVIGKKDARHFLISSGEGIGLKQGTFFETQTQPRALLQLVLFEKTSSGKTRGVLRLIQGEPPSIGSTLNTTEAPEWSKKSTKGVLK